MKPKSVLVTLKLFNVKVKPRRLRLTSWRNASDVLDAEMLFKNTMDVPFTAADAAVVSSPIVETKMG